MSLKKRENKHLPILQRAAAHTRAAAISRPAVSALGQVVQRQILHEQGVSRYINPAERHAVGNSSLGFTPPTVNFRNIGSAADIIAAFRGYDQLLRAEQVGEGAFRAEVDTVPTNNMGYMMYLPMPGPWTYVANKRFILGLLGVHDNGQNTTDEITVEITGPGGHATLAQQIEAHETIHARDNLRIRDEIFKPWDARLATLKRDGRKFDGATAEAAKGNLLDSVGGNLAQVAGAANRAWGAASDTFHGSDNGETRMDNGKTGVSPNQKKATICYYLTI